MWLSEEEIMKSTESCLEDFVLYPWNGTVFLKCFQELLL